MTLSLAQAAASLFPAPSAALPRDDGPVCAMAVDAEEDFDWQRPVASIERSTECMRHIGPLQEIAASGMTNADRMLEAYHGRWGGDVGHVYAEDSY